MVKLLVPREKWVGKLLEYHAIKIKINENGKERFVALHRGCLLYTSMPFIAPELIIQAKQMDLLTYLKNYETYELVKFSDNTYCTRTHDSLKISNGKWIWWSRGIGGRSALDYLIKVKGYSFLEAVETIIGHTAIQAPV